MLPSIIMNNNSVSPKAQPRLFLSPTVPTLLHPRVPSSISSAFSPPAKVFHPPHSPQKPSSEYLLHLIPNAQQSSQPTFHTVPSTMNPPMQYTFFPAPQHTFPPSQPEELQDNKSFRSSSGMPQNRNAVSSPQAFSQVARSKGLSEFGQRMNSQMHQRDGRNSQYQQHPRSPKQIVSIEPVRRVSNHRDLQSDNKSRSSSQHIHITIESTIEGETAPTITISPNNKKHSEITSHNQNSSTLVAQRVVNFHPQAFPIVPRPTNITQTVVSQQAPIHLNPQPVILNQPPTIISHHHPIFIHPSQPANPPSQTSLSPNQKESLQQNTLPTYSHTSAHPPNNDILTRDPGSSISTAEKNTQRYKKISIENAPRHQYYNESPAKLEQDDLAGSRQYQNKTTGFSAYLTEEKMLSSTRRLIDQIFENETNRAILQMRMVEAQSRENTHRKSKSRKSKF